MNMLNAQYALDHAEAGFTFLCVSPGVGSPRDFRAREAIADLLVVAKNRSGWKLCRFTG